MLDRDCCRGRETEREQTHLWKQFLLGMETGQEGIGLQGRGRWVVFEDGNIYLQVSSPAVW